jgi:hypothetical protein
MSEDHKGAGAKPTIKFVFNGRMNMGMALALNNSATQIKEHLGRFDGPYVRYKENGIVFHIQTATDEPTIPVDLSETKQKMIYTFVKKQNSLFCGLTCVRTDVSKKLRSPARSYSTFALRCFRRVVKLL